MSKLLRLHHWHRMARVFEGFNTARHSRVLELAKLLGKMLLTGHVLACAWFWVGTVSPSQTNKQRPHIECPGKSTRTPVFHCEPPPPFPVLTGQVSSLPLY
jgi:hypothetical protein